MGANESKLSFLTYEDAVKRCSEDELQHIRETFKRHSGSSNVLSKSVFFSELLGDLVPSQLAEQLYSKCGGASKGIGFREVVVLLILITNGTLDEKVRFLFHLVSIDGNVITQKELENLYFLCDNISSTPPTCISNAFWKRERLSYEDFFEWVISNCNFSGVTCWLLEEQLSNHAIKISNSFNIESFYTSLANLTKFTEQDVKELEKRYWGLKAISPNGKFDLQTFKVHVCPPLPEQFLDGVFEFFDQNNDGHIDFKELVCGISLCCRGSNTERLRACFEIFDIDGDNYLSRDDLVNMSTGLHEISQQYGTKVHVNEQQHTINTFNLADDEKLSLTEFQHWGYSSSLVYEFVLLLSQICHIVFGLCPLFKKEEGNIVRRWIERESMRGLQFGSLYYIVSITWWNAWKKYVSFDNNGSSPVQLIKKRNSDESDCWCDEIDGNVNNVNVNDICSESVLSGDKNHFAFTNETSLKSHNMIHMSSRNCTPESPGPIENVHLIEPSDNRKLMVLTGEGGKLKEDVVLIYGKNYQVVPEPIWRALSSWYDADVALPRTVIIEPGDSAAELELYPIQIDLYRHTQPPRGVGFNMGALGINNIMSQIYGNIVSNPQSGSNVEQPALSTPKRTLQYRASFSRKNTVRQILDFLSHRLKIELEDLRLWVMDDEQEILLLEEEEKAVGDIVSNNEGKLLIEVRNRDLSWPEEMSSLVTTRNFRERSNTGPLERGATGLHNLGNTCFMNSAIQCLSNTKPLTQYFSKKLFEYELNKSNPLGMKGVLAKRYGDMILDLWSGIYRSIAPVKLRCTLGRYAPRFNGFQQHDSQEFLSFLLDGLHEDLNRVHDKPYVELKDSDGRPDSIVAHEAWDNHVKRNQSIIVDLFQGQLKSQVRCLHCSHCSVTFDPFTFLSLPLPMESSIHLEIPVFWKSGEQATKYGILLSQATTIKMLKGELSKLSCVPAHKLLLAEVGGARILKFLADKLKIHQNLSGYIFAYELEHDASEVINTKFSTLYDNNKSNTSSKESINKTNTTSSTLLSNSSTSTHTLDNNKQVNGLPRDNTDIITSERKIKNSSKILKPKSRFYSNNVSPARVIEVAVATDSDTSKINGQKLRKDEDTLEVGEDMNDEIDVDNSLSHSLSSQCILNTQQGFIIIAMHRKMIQSNHYFLSWQKLCASLFGIPMVLSHHNEMTNKQLYMTVWKHVSKYVTGVVLNQDDIKYPFVIKSVDKDGNYCFSCEWYKFCRGCAIECNDAPFNVLCTHIAIDWDSTTFHLHYQQAQERNFCNDVSIQDSLRQMREPISLDQCLKDFIKEEELGEDETWYCSKCKEHRTIAKKLEIWKLPPVFVIHLKRFLSVNNRWIKSNKLVRFPIKLFDPSMYVAKNILNKTNSDSCFSSSSSNLSTKVESVDFSSTSTESCISKDDCCDKVESESGICCSPVTLESSSSITMRETVEVACDRNEYGYSLYAICCHSGMLNGGHYITFAKNPNGKWYCYNDSSCKEVDIDLIEKESPYLLFFEKTNLKCAHYMPDVSHLEAINIQLEEEEFEKEVKKYCCVM